MGSNVRFLSLRSPMITLRIFSNGPSCYVAFSAFHSSHAALPFLLSGLLTSCSCLPKMFRPTNSFQQIRIASTILVRCLSKHSSRTATRKHRIPKTFVLESSKAATFISTAVVSIQGGRLRGCPIFMTWHPWRHPLCRCARMSCRFVFPAPYNSFPNHVTAQTAA